MPYKKLADFVFAFHMFWAALLLGGIFLSFTVEWYKPVHYVVLGTTIASQVIWGWCPLTVLENKLRQKEDPDHDAYEPFTVRCLEQHFGVIVSPQIITGTLVAIAIITSIVVARSIQLI